MVISIAFVIVALLMIDGALIAGAHYLLGISFRGQFHRYWSVGLSVIAPIMLGRACVKRFGTRSVWGLALAYAFVQPIAYGVRFFPGEHIAVAVCVEDAEYGQINRKDVLAVSDTQPPGLSPTAKCYDVTSPSQLPEEDADQLLAHTCPPGKWLAWLRIKLSPVLFATLAVLKLVFCALFLQQIQRVSPAEHGSIIQDHGSTVLEFREKHWLEMDPSGRKWVFFSLLLLAVVVLSINLLFHFDLTLVAAYGVFTGLVAFVMRCAGGTWDDLLGRKPKNDG